MSEGQRSEQALVGGAKNENVAWFDTEKISTGAPSLVDGAPIVYFEYRGGIC